MGAASSFSSAPDFVCLFFFCLICLIVFVYAFGTCLFFYYFFFTISSIMQNLYYEYYNIIVKHKYVVGRKTYVLL